MSKFKLSKCLPYDTLLIVLLVLVSLVYIINLLNNKYVEDKYENATKKYSSLLNKVEGYEDNPENDSAETEESNEPVSANDLEKDRVNQLIQNAYNDYLNAKSVYDKGNKQYSDATLKFNEAVEDKKSNEEIATLSDERNSASAALYVNLRKVNDTKNRLDNLKNQYPEEYSKIVVGSDVKELQVKKETKHQVPHIIHNHYNQYYGGNQEMTKFLKQLTQELKENNKKDGDMTLMDQGMCSELNNKLSTMTLAEFKNNRFVQDLKSKCEKSDGVDCSFRPTNSQTALLGTLLEDAQKTRVGDIIPKEEITTDYN